MDYIKSDKTEVCFGLDCKELTMIDIIAELEHKVNELLGKLDEYKNELNVIREEVEGKNNYIHEIEQDNGNLHNELEALRNSSQEKDHRINEGVDKLRGIMDRVNNKLENNG